MSPTAAGQSQHRWSRDRLVHPAGPPAVGVTEAQNFLPTRALVITSAVAIKLDARSGEHRRAAQSVGAIKVTSPGVDAHRAAS